MDYFNCYCLKAVFIVIYLKKKWKDQIKKQLLINVCSGPCMVWLRNGWSWLWFHLRDNLAHSFVPSSSFKAIFFLSNKTALFTLTVAVYFRKDKKMSFFQCCSLVLNAHMDVPNIQTSTNTHKTNWLLLLRANNSSFIAWVHIFATQKILACVVRYVFLFVLFCFFFLIAQRQIHWLCVLIRQR